MLHAWHYPHYSNQGGEPSGAIRQGEYKLIEFYEDSKLELYNIRKDPGEQDDLAAQMSERASELRTLLQDWRKLVNAQMPTLNPNYDVARANQGLTGSQMTKGKKANKGTP